LAASVVVSSTVTPFEGLRINRGTLFYALSLISIGTGYYLYWWLWKLKAYFIGWGLCLVIAGGMIAFGRLSAHRLARDALPVVVWYAYLLASAMWSPSPSTTLYYLSVGLVNVVAFIVSYFWTRSTSRWALSGFFEFQAFLIIPFVLWFLFTIGQLYDETHGSLRTEFASTCLIALPFLIWRVRHKASPRTIGILVAALVVILAGESPSGLLIMPILAVGALFFVAKDRRKAVRSMAPIVVVFLFLSVVAVSMPSFREAFAHSVGRLSPSGTSLSVSSSILDEVAGSADAQVDTERRLQLFIAMQSFLSHPILGAGYESTYTIIHNEFGWEVSAHGLPSMLLGETGLVGTMIFMWMIIRFFRRVNAQSRVASADEKDGFLATCRLTMVGILLLGLFHQVDQSQLLFVLLAWGYSGDTRQAPRLNFATA